MNPNYPPNFRNILQNKIHDLTSIYGYHLINRTGQEDKFQRLINHLQNALDLHKELIPDD